MRFAFVFPGQGSQSVGMLDEFRDHPVVKETFEEASDALRQDISRLIAQGPANQLNLTTHTQPAMLTAAYAIYRVWKQAGGMVPAVIAGHSLGEYTALVAADSITFRDAVLLVHFRAQAMQQAVQMKAGGMAAILGLDDNTVLDVCSQAGSDGIVEAVNFNAPTQIVIAGHIAALKKACEIATTKGAKRAILLPVSGPFHSSLLKPASDRLREYLADVSIRAPQIPLINNVDVAIVSDPIRIKDALVRQTASPVRWVECVRSIAAQKITHIIECGPGKVLAGITRCIDANLVSGAIVDPTSLNDTLKLLQH
ncbi:ACP S-malonyltransferase [Candidatus Vallotia tarda]|uniref:Malonyl CoA-acyl carrier protein transacylase n=1 Tax=Candidatus Vallotiella hemipterorum TaxID=1177213 RepID=A0A916NFF5_9BURK|nr:ACP S-malonyltransferase [Candidatus Vallotia tarda]CAG7598538.1 Malonyl CoA-acyl carrier protein transacylase [Candidatus Vallotia tarda]